MCFCGNLDPNCVKSEHHPEKWLEVRQILQYRCNLCSVKNPAESPGEYILCQLQCVMPSPWGNKRRTINSGRVARGWAAVARSISKWKICSYPVRTLWLSYIYLTDKGPTGAWSCKFSFQHRQRSPSHSKAFLQAIFFLMHLPDPDKLFFFFSFFLA